MGRRDALAGHLRALALDPDTLARLARYETRLDRKFERTLAMPISLQALRALPGGAQRDPDTGTDGPGR